MLESKAVPNHVHPQWKQYARGPYLWESLWFGWLLRRDVTEAVLEKTWREGRSDSVQADLERADEIKSLVLKTQADLIFYAHPDRMEFNHLEAKLLHHEAALMGEYFKLTNGVTLSAKVDPWVVSRVRELCQRANLMQGESKDAYMEEDPEGYPQPAVYPNSIKSAMLREEGREEDARLLLQTMEEDMYQKAWKRVKGWSNQACGNGGCCCVRWMRSQGSKGV